LQTGSSFDFGKNTFFIGVRNRENALKLLRHAFIDEISSDTDEPRHLLGARHEQTNGRGKKPSAGNKFYLAVAKDMILVAAVARLCARRSRKAPLPDGKPPHALPLQSQRRARYS